MERVQVQFTDGQQRALKRMASALGVSFSEAVRRCVEEHLAREGGSEDKASRARAARAVVGKYASGKHDVARRHDAELADAYRA